MQNSATMATSLSASTSSGSSTSTNNNNNIAVVSSAAVGGGVSAITVITTTAAATAAAVGGIRNNSNSSSSSSSNNNNISSSSYNKNVSYDAATTRNGHELNQNGITANNINNNNNKSQMNTTTGSNRDKNIKKKRTTAQNNHTNNTNNNNNNSSSSSSSNNSNLNSGGGNGGADGNGSSGSGGSGSCGDDADTHNNVNNNDNNNSKQPTGGDGNNNNNGTTTIAVTRNTNIKLDKSNQEIIRLIAQYLQDIGLEKTMKTLIAESGCSMEHPAASKFRQHVLSGEWNKADADLKKLELLIDNGKASTITEMKFILLEQKYLEYLDDGHLLDALHVLRNELIPLQHNKSRMPQLSSFIMCTNNQTLHQCAKWDGKGILSRALVMDKLQAFMPASVMMPPRRLRHLLQQAVEMQSQHCPCHDMAWETNLQNVSLLTDHCCATDGFPMRTIQILTEHCDEVWVCKFSPDGLKLATGCKDSTVIIWDVDPFKFQLKQRRVLDGQSQMSVAFVSWSPDSKMLLVGGPEDSSEIYVWNIEDGQLVTKVNNAIDESLQCGAFNRDGTRFVCGGQRGHFYLVDLAGTILERWEGIRVNNVAFRADNKTILASDNHYRIRGYNFENPRADFDILMESHPIMAFSLNSTDRLALLNIANQGLHLWDIEDKCLIRRYQGIRQSNFAINSCFGGVNESFVASGSEDKLVCIWHIRREEPLTKLSGHTKTVNCVSWNPVYPSLLASASDDATVRIWGPKNIPNSNASPESEECTSCSTSSSWNMTS